MREADSAAPPLSVDGSGRGGGACGRQAQQLHLFQWTGAAEGRGMREAGSAAPPLSVDGSKPESRGMREAGSAAPPLQGRSRMSTRGRGANVDTPHRPISFLPPAGSAHWALPKPGGFSLRSVRSLSIHQVLSHKVSLWLHWENSGARHPFSGNHHPCPMMGSVGPILDCRVF